MYNILLDPLPDSYEGYLIRTDYRIGIQMCQCMQDDELDQTERIAIAVNLLFGAGVPDLETALAGVKWFIGCGKAREGEGGGKTLFYWDFDAERLYSSFKSTYGIDIHKMKMHWFEFVALIGSLRNDSAFNQAIQVRTYDTSNLKGKHKAEINRMKRNLTPTTAYTEEEQQAIDDFFGLLDSEK